MSRRSALRHYERLPAHDDELDAFIAKPDDTDHHHQHHHDDDEEDKLLGASPSVAAPWATRLGARLPLVKGFTNRRVYTHYLTPRRRKRSILRCIYWSVFGFPYACLFLVLVASILFPSYTHRPQHYVDLRNRAERSHEPGRANIHREKIFIAASIYEDKGALTSGAWGDSMVELVDLLGPDNVHLSLYENDADATTKQSLVRFEKRLPCNKTIVAEDLDLQPLPRVTTPNGERRIKRIAFLAEVRNRALAPLFESDVAFDRLLYVNDVNFDPVEAAQLLLSTNADPNTGRANYAAACAVDFINAFKFYDRFALRDTEGYPPGIPFFPWFTSAGNAISRRDVQSGTDAVRVRSCWGGMTAFEAKWFQQQHHHENGLTASLKDKDRDISTTISSSNRTSLATAPTPDKLPQHDAPLRFRYDTDPFWESSECCLIHADLQFLRDTSPVPSQAGIYMNPFIRVAYDTKTLSWLSLVRRPERLYSLIHDILNYFVGFPGSNERQFEEPGQRVTDVVWEFDHASSQNKTGGGAKGGQTAEGGEAEFHGRYRSVSRVAGPGGFCGTRQLLIINEDVSEGGERWGKVALPEPPSSPPPPSSPTLAKS